MNKALAILCWSVTVACIGLDAEFLFLYNLLHGLLFWPIVTESALIAVVGGAMAYLGYCFWRK